MHSHFINRKTELSYLSSWLDRNSDDSNILLMRAPTGIGKTDLAKRALQNVAAPVIHVEVVNHPDYEAEDGEYILRLFRSLAHLSEQDKRIINIDSFLELRNDKRHALKAAGAATKHAVMHIGKKYLGEESVESVKSILSKDVTSLRQLGDGKPELIKSEVVTYTGVVFSSVRCVVHIENVQKIDRASLEYLRWAFSQYPGQKGIFEYTSTSNNRLPCETIQATLESDRTQCSIYELQPIPVGELLSGLKDRPDIFRSALTRHYQEQQYNLRVIVDVNILATQPLDDLEFFESEGCDSTGKRAIRSLPNDQRLLLGLVATHGGEVDAEVIYAAIANQQSRLSAMGIGFNCKRSIKELCSVKYLIAGNQKIRSAHDSDTVNFLTDQSNKKFILIATDIWEHFYNEALIRNDSFLKLDALHWLPVLYLGSGKIEQLIASLEQQGRDALGSLAPHRLVRIFNKIRKLSSQSVSASIPGRLDALIEQQGIVLFDSCLLDEACECLSQSNSLSVTGKLVYADACISTNRYGEGISMLEDIENEFSNTTQACRSVQIRTGLIRVHAMRTSGELKQAESLFRNLLTWDDFKDQPVYASLLRCADIGLYQDKDIDECIALLEQSVELCGKHGLLADKAAAHIALCQHFGYRGELVRAQEELSAADELSQKVWIERYSIINNQAVLDIMANQKSDAVSDFQKALMLATEDGDRLLLLCNYIAVGDYSVAEELSRLLGEIEDISEELSKIAHYNLSVFYAKCGDSLQSEYHRGVAATMADTMDKEFWGGALRGQKVESEGGQLRVNCSYYLVFIVHWNLSSMALQGVYKQSF
ncbi:MAG: hypothetical protein PHX61_14380 [Alphaproteobacteria bacterium]|nr:hypothetical protein [Alphaproteobacteria bacterium]